MLAHWNKSTCRYEDGRFVLDKHTELDSYSAGSLKQQSTGRYEDGRFVLDKHAELDSYMKQKSVNEMAYSGIRNF